MKKMFLAPVAALFLLSLSACDVGSDAPAEVSLPVFEFVEELDANDPRLIAATAAARATFPSLFAQPNGLKFDPSNSFFNEAITIRTPNGESETYVVSLFLDPSGRPLGVGTSYNVSSGQVIVSGFTSDRSVFYLDGNSSVIRIKFDEALNYAGTSFNLGVRPGGKAEATSQIEQASGGFTQAQAAQIEQAFREFPNLVRYWEIDETRSTLYQELYRYFSEGKSLGSYSFVTLPTGGVQITVPVNPPPYNKQSTNAIRINLTIAGLTYIPCTPAVGC